MSFNPEHCELCGGPFSGSPTLTDSGLVVCKLCASPGEHARAAEKARPLGVRVARPVPGMSSRERNLHFRDEYLRSHPCVVCGEDRLPVLEFDHLPERGIKRASVSALAFKGVSLERLVAEIALCEVVCCNCRKLRTDMRRTNESRRNQTQQCSDLGDVLR